MIVGLLGACDLLRLSPYIYLISLPLYGAFCGVDACCRLSLLMCVYGAATSIIPESWSLLSMVVNVLSMVLLLLVPIQVVPTVLTTCYYHLMWVSEAPLLILDCYQLVLTSMTLSYTVVTDHLDASPRFYKCLMLFASSICYTVACYYSYTSWYTNGHALYWLLFVVVLLVFTAHCFMYTFEEGIITDAAMVAAVSLIMLNMFYHNASYVKVPLEVPDTWDRPDILKFSSIEILYEMTTYNIEQAKIAVAFLSKMLTLGYVLLFLIRLWSIFCATVQILNKFSNEFYDDMTWFDKIISCRPVLSVTLVFVYTQTILSHLYMCTSTLWAYYLSSVTLVQAIALPIMYMYQLYKVETSGWNFES